MPDWRDLLDDQPSNMSGGPLFSDLLERRLNRRTFAVGGMAAGAAAFTGFPVAMANSRHFTETERGVDADLHVAPGYKADILIRWGDPVVKGAPAFDPYNQTADSQEQQFGYNNDYVGFLPIPLDARNPSRGLLCVNHEYTTEEMMFPGMIRQDKKRNFRDMTQALVEIEMAAHGGSIIEVEKSGGKWRTVPGSRYNRRISARRTEMRMAGPAAGTARLKTNADLSGALVIGTVNNCAGGLTPWGTYLMAEENFNFYFSGDVSAHPEAEKLKRYGAPRKAYAWGDYFDRFDVSKEPNEINRFGWIVEVDPFEPNSMPVKRTALGRFKHEGAECIVNRDGRVVVYSGDDQQFDYLYKFVSKGVFNAESRAANKNLLDEGTLYVAAFNEDGSMAWLPLAYGQGPLTPKNGFNSQADVLIDARLAADALGATKLDRPEDVQPNPKTGKVYVMLTNNSRRKPDQLDAVNRRAKNIWGQIIEISPEDQDHGAETARWDMLVQCGNPQMPDAQASWHAGTSPNGWFACPDNATVDSQGNLWISTDQGRDWAEASGGADGIWQLETEEPARGLGRMLLRAPIGAEVCGPHFTPGDTALFAAIQHPGVDGAEKWDEFGRKSSFADPATRWPDYDPNMPPRPSVIVISKLNGGVVGS